MFNNLCRKKLFLLGTLVFLAFSASNIYAKNPITLFSPNDNITDPGSTLTPWGGCGPTDSNCYVKQTELFTNPPTKVKVEKVKATTELTVSQQTLLSALRTLLSSPTLPTDILINLRGPQGLTGPKGDTNIIIQTSSPVSAGSVIAPNPTSYYSGGSLFSATDLSSTNFITHTAKVTTLDVTGNSTLASLNVTGDSTFNNLNVSGILTAPSMIVSKLYPATDSTTAIQINKADGITNVMNFDTPMVMWG